MRLESRSINESIIIIFITIFESDCVFVNAKGGGRGLGVAGVRERRVKVNLKIIFVVLSNCLHDRNIVLFFYKRHTNFFRLIKIFED